ncbi:hypothetical protein FQA47_011044 [Oryzias melastigma]|uniref:Uncharacterized protein n=1 Tax=Oryzias melastigma TaxID=30732 RepID=A0A834C146_ORYME|nr:hypothetical protein FQA47_011044 [Oryzias melastigma]
MLTGMQGHYPPPPPFPPLSVTGEWQPIRAASASVTSTATSDALLGKKASGRRGQRGRRRRQRKRDPARAEQMREKRKCRGGKGERNQRAGRRNGAREGKEKQRVREWSRQESLSAHTDTQTHRSARIRTSCAVVSPGIMSACVPVAPGWVMLVIGLGKVVLVLLERPAVLRVHVLLNLIQSRLCSSPSLIYGGSVARSV